MTPEMKELILYIKNGEITDVIKNQLLALVPLMNNPEVRQRIADLLEIENKRAVVEQDMLNVYNNQMTSVDKDLETPASQ